MQIFIELMTKASKEISNMISKRIDDPGKGKIKIKHFFKIELSSASSENRKKYIDSDLAKRLNGNIFKF
jgi:hypothetical protein